MGMPVVTVALGGFPVVEAALGTPVTEVASGFGMPVTKVVGRPGMPVVFETIGLAPGTTYATWDAATATAATLAGGNLAATNTGTTSMDQGVKVANAAGKTTGKYYFEGACTTKINGACLGFGIGTFASTYTFMGERATTGNVCYILDGYCGTMWTYPFTIGAVAQGEAICIAADITNRRIWFRRGAAGNWNASATANPATNTEGQVIPAGTMVPFATFGGLNGVANNVITGNFGASGFAGAVPSGFTSGWPV
jgi:hypothetical protein